MFAAYPKAISIIDISTILKILIPILKRTIIENIAIDKDNFENINIDRDEDNFENIDIDINKDILGKKIYFSTDLRLFSIFFDEILISIVDIAAFLKYR